MTSPASSIFGIPATGAITDVERLPPVDKGGLAPKQDDTTAAVFFLCSAAAAGLLWVWRGF